MAWAIRLLAQKVLEGRAAPLLLHTVLRPHVCSARATLACDVQPTRRSWEIPVAQSIASPRRARPPGPTALPLAMMPASRRCPPIRESSAAPSKGSDPTSHSSLCGLHRMGWATQAEPRAVEQPTNIHPRLVVAALRPTSARCLFI